MGETRVVSGNGAEIVAEVSFSFEITVTES